MLHAVAVYKSVFGLKVIFSENHPLSLCGNPCTWFNLIKWTETNLSHFSFSFHLRYDPEYKILFQQNIIKGMNE